MNQLTPTHIRLPKEELRLYRQLALQSGKSLAHYIRDILRQYSHQVLTKGQADFAQIQSKQTHQKEPLQTLKPFKSSITDGASKHDSYIY